LLAGIHKQPVYVYHISSMILENLLEFQSHYPASTMRLKSFYADTMTKAMKMVRDTLGENAIIVATREEDGGRTVRVTAAIEQDIRHSDYNDKADFGFYTGDENIAEDMNNDNGWLQYDDEGENGVVEKLTDVMLRHSIPEDITDQILSCATVVGIPEPGDALIAAIEHLFSFGALSQEPSETAIMMVGPPGCGKTLTVAKLAARAVMDGLDVAVITTDTVRAGGVEQLASLTKIMNINLQRASDAKALKQCLVKSGNADKIFIDTGSINPFEPENMRDLARLISAGDIEPVLVVPAGMDADETGEIARVYGPLGIRSMIATRLDFARRLGGLLSAAHHGGLVFADASDTTQVADGLIPLSPQILSELLMPEITRHRSKAKSTKDTVRTKKQKVTAG